MEKRTKQSRIDRAYQRTSSFFKGHIEVKRILSETQSMPWMDHLSSVQKEIGISASSPSVDEFSYMLSIQDMFDPPTRVLPFHLQLPAPCVVYYGIRKPTVNLCVMTSLLDAESIVDFGSPTFVDFGRGRILLIRHFYDDFVCIRVKNTHWPIPFEKWDEIEQDYRIRMG
jgi:hypothetical protein